MGSVSVIIPTYNRANLLDEAIRSVLAGTFADFEVIVVDDGSTDDIQGVVAKYDDVRLRYERLPHGGVSKARNHGIRVAHGEYIAFLDSDDLYLPQKLAKQVAFFDQHPDAGMVYTAYTSVNEGLEPQREHAAPTYANYREMLVACTIATPTVMVRREVFEKVGVFDETMHLAEDIDLWCRIFRYYPIVPLHEPLTLVRLHESGTPRDPEAILTAYMHLLIKAFRADPTIPWLDRRRMLARMHYITAADVYARIDPNSTDPNKYGTYRFYHVKAARYFPFSRLGARVLFNHYTRGIRAFSSAFKEGIRQVLPADRTNTAIEALHTEIAGYKQQINELQSMIERVKEDAVHDPAVIDQIKTDVFGDLTPHDVEQIATWVERQADTSTLYPIFHRHGFHLLRRHYYLPIPEVDDLVYTDRLSQLVGIDMDERAAFRLIEEVIKPTKAEFNAFPIHQPDTHTDTDFYLINSAFMAVDGNVYYGLLRTVKPRRVVEIGSGFSTRLAAAAIRRNMAEGGQATDLTCIEPYPSAALQTLAGESFVNIMPTKVQEVDLELFTSLEAGDILFIDSSHVLRTGNDVWYEYCEILPRLKPGVWAHVHDISLPKPYPQTYFDHQVFWNEQYLLQAMLAHNPRYEVMWAGNYLFTTCPDDMQAVFQPEYNIMRDVYPSSEPSSFWMRIRGKEAQNS